jgi:outer membrane protein assembly factor BamD
MRRLRTFCVVIVGFAAAACAGRLDVSKFKGTNEELYEKSFKAFQKHNWDDAVAGFEKLTLELPAHDTLLSRAHFYLGEAHEHRGEYLLAAQSYSRLAESFPDDSLADRALYDAGRSYQKMWHRPDLDASNGESALTSYQQLLSLYPGSPLAADGQRQIARLDEWFAIKDYLNGVHYYKHHAYDSAIIYLKDVVKNYPTTATARLAQLKLVDAYRAIKYQDDANDVCAQLRTSFPGDREVHQRCGIATASAQSGSKP